jgi:hypothetical protein
VVNTEPPLCRGRRLKPAATGTLQNWDSNIRHALDVRLAFPYRKKELEEANHAKSSRRHDESGGTAGVAMCPAR